MEKPRYYRGIPPVRKRDSSLETGRTHLQYNASLLTGRLSAEVVALQPLHVGSGLFTPPDALGLHAPDVPLIKAWVRNPAPDGPGDPVIPGSSLKGVFRSLVEMLTEACICKTSDRNQQNECRYEVRRHSGELCPACKIFGAMGYQGQARFVDAEMVEGRTAVHFLPPQYPPRIDRDNPRRRYYPHALVDLGTDQTWPLEVVATGARFALKGQFTNLSEAELGVLLIVLGQGKWALCPKVGAGKSCGMGSVRIENLSIETLKVQNAYTALDTDDVWTPPDANACMDRAEATLIRSTVLKELSETLRFAEAPHG